MRAATMKRTAVFLDRDGTIIENTGYIGDPGQVRLIPDAADAILRFHRAGCLVVVVSNQSGVARGYFDETAMNQVDARMKSLLAERGTRLDRAYYCPYLDGPEATVEAYRRDSELRKPRPGMLLLAAKELEIDLSRSWMIGDSPTDVQAGVNAGCRTILLRRASSSPHDSRVVVLTGVAPTAVDQSTGGEPGDVVGPHCVATMTEAADLVERAMKQDHEPITSSPSPNPTAHSLQSNVRGEGMIPDNAVLLALEKIHNQLERAQRKERQHDFSFLRLFGALLQMLAIVVALWGVIALMDDQSPPATARLTLACYFQLAALTAFAIDRFR